MSAETLSKIAMLPKILEAAKLLQSLDLLSGKQANEFVREYVRRNPDINATLSVIN